MKHRFLFIMALLLTAASAWADDDPIDLTPSAVGTVWTLPNGMPEYDVELEVVYKTDLTLSVSIDNWTYGGTAATPSVTGNTSGGAVTYAYKKKVAADDTYSTEVPTDVGEYTVRATVAETDDYADGTATADFTIAPMSLTDAMIQTIADQTYTGSALTPDITVKDGETTLVLNTDYEIANYTNNTNAASSTDASAPTVTITGKGNYSGSASKTFTIAPKSLTDEMIQAIADQTYTGSALTPEITVTDGETTLVLNTDYENVVFTNNTNAAASTAGESAPTVTVTGKGNYSGSITKTFTITKATATISYTTTEVSKAFGDAAFTNTLSMDPATGTGLGTVAYTSSNDDVATIDASTGEVTITGTGSATITATVTDGTNYTYSGMEGYNTESKTASVKYTLTVNPVSLEGATVTLSQESYDYDGTAKEPTVSSVILNSNTLAGTDYSVSYSNNINAAASTAGESAPTVTITGIGNYSGEITKTFTINKATATISYATTTVSKAFGNAAFTNTLTKTPATGTGLGTVTYAVTAETKDADCTSEHVATINASTGEVTITGTGSATITATATDGDNYTYGSTNTATYTLTVAKGTITASAYSRSYTYDGYSHSIDVRVSRPSSGYAIEYSTDNSSWSSTKPSRYQVGSTTVYYKVTAPNYNDKTGSATVTITRATGSIAFDPTEVTKTWGDDNFTKTYSSKTGNGSITYSSDDVNVATVTNSGEVTIKAAGTARIKVSMAQSTNYTSASATYTLTVNPVDLSEAVIALDQTSFDYDGTEKKPNVKFAILNETTVLKADKDYTVSYADNVNAGTEALAIISGIGNYTGTASQTFTINSVTTTDGNITVVDGGSETVLTINDMGTQQGKTLTPGMQVTTLNYYRSLNASDESVYTVCLPYAPKTDASLKYYTLTGCEGTTLQFDEITGTPQAYTPYLVSASKTTDIGTENLNEAITMSQTVDNSFSAGNYVMKGSLSGFTHDQSVGKYILQSSNRWGLVGSDTHAYIPPFRAYIEATVSGARMLDSSFYDEATGIYSLRTVDRDGTERYYDLNGRRIDDPKKTGIYIRNGRKEVLK